MLNIRRLSNVPSEKTHDVQPVGAHDTLNVVACVVDFLPQATAAWALRMMGFELLANV